MTKFRISLLWRNALWSGRIFANFFVLQIILQCFLTQWLYFILFYFIFFCWRIYSFIFPFIFISWRLITLRYCSGFCHTLTWISHGFTCVPHPDPRSHLPLHPIPLEWNIYKIKQSRCTCANNAGNFRSHPKSTHKTHMRRLVIDSLSENSFPSFISIIR